MKWDPLNLALFHAFSQMPCAQRIFFLDGSPASGVWVIFLFPLSGLLRLTVMQSTTEVSLFQELFHTRD